jgi:hypothetical protein
MPGFWSEYGMYRTSGVWFKDGFAEDIMPKVFDIMDTDKLTQPNVKLTVYFLYDKYIPELRMCNQDNDHCAVAARDPEYCHFLDGNYQFMLSFALNRLLAMLQKITDSSAIGSWQKESSRQSMVFLSSMILWALSRINLMNLFFLILKDIQRHGAKVRFLHNDGRIDHRRNLKRWAHVQLFL